MNKIQQTPEYTNNSLDASVIEPFTCKSFYDLLSEAHLINEEYYLARVNCIGDNSNIYYCYDAKQLCKYMFETVVDSEGRKIRIKNFNDPIHSKEISEVNFFKLRNIDGNVPLRAEPVGNHVTFLESNVFRAKVFREEDALDSLTVNFQFNEQTKKSVVTKKKVITIVLTFIAAIITLCLIYTGIKYYESLFIFIENLSGKSLKNKDNNTISDELNKDSIKFGRSEANNTNQKINDENIESSSKNIRNADGANLEMDNKKYNPVKNHRKSRTINTHNKHKK